MLTSVCIYKSPSDFPQQHVARRFIGEEATEAHYAHDELEAVRAWAIKELESITGIHPVCFGRHPADDPVLLEVWF